MRLDGLTVPATASGVWRGARGLWLGRPIQIWEPMDGGRWATFHGEPDGGEQAPWFRYEAITDIALDMRDRMTRLELLSRLAERALGKAAGGATWKHLPDITQLRSPGGRHRWALTTSEGRAIWSSHGWGNYGLPALAELDITNDACLDDGMPIVDVQALVIVASAALPQPGVRPLDAAAL